MPDEIQRLIIQVENEAKVKQLTELMTAQKKTLEELLALQARGPLAGGQQATLQRVAALTVQTQADLRAVQGATRGMMGAQGTMQLGYALQDFFAAQGGMAQKFNAIANNLQMVAVSMGATGPWFIGITAAIAGFQLLANNMEKLEGLLMGLNPEEVKKSGEKLKESMAKWKTMQAKPTELGGAEPGAAGKIVEEFGGAEIGEGVSKALAAGAMGVPVDAGQQKRLQEAAAMTQVGILHPGLLGAMSLMGTKLLPDVEHEVAKEQIGKLMADIDKPGAEGTSARMRIEGIEKKFPGTFPKNFMFRFRAAQVGAIKKIQTPPDLGEGMEMPWEELKPPPFMEGGTGILGTGAVVPREGLTVPGTMPKQAGAPLIQAPQPQRRRRRYLQTAPEHFGLGGMTQPEMQAGTAAEFQGQAEALQGMAGAMQNAQGLNAQLGRTGGGYAQQIDALNQEIMRARMRASELQGGQAYSASPSYYP
jgi:hypothetical protein